ncbi:hypothetical protein BJX96DRAFT_35270 [Aspergillus floccosus]
MVKVRQRTGLRRGFYSVLMHGWIGLYFSPCQRLQRYGPPYIEGTSIPMVVITGAEVPVRAVEIPHNPPNHCPHHPPNYCNFTFWATRVPVRVSPPRLGDCHVVWSTPVPDAVIPQSCPILYPEEIPLPSFYFLKAWFCRSRDPDSYIFKSTGSIKSFIRHPLGSRASIPEPSVY